MNERLEHFDNLITLLKLKNEQISLMKGALNYIYRHAEERLTDHELDIIEQALGEK